MIKKATTPLRDEFSLISLISGGQDGAHGLSSSDTRGVLFCYFSDERQQNHLVIKVSESQASCGVWGNTCRDLCYSGHH